MEMDQVTARVVDHQMEMDQVAALAAETPGAGLPEIILPAAIPQAAARPAEIIKAARRH